jgi:hypothetical protein
VRVFASNSIYDNPSQRRNREYGCNRDKGARARQLLATMKDTGEGGTYAAIYLVEQCWSECTDNGKEQHG